MAGHNTHISGGVGQVYSSKYLLIVCYHRVDRLRVSVACRKTTDSEDFLCAYTALVEELVCHITTDRKVAAVVLRCVDHWLGIFGVFVSAQLSHLTINDKSLYFPTKSLLPSLLPSRVVCPRLFRRTRVFWG